MKFYANYKNCFILIQVSEVGSYCPIQVQRGHITDEPLAASLIVMYVST